MANITINSEKCKGCLLCVSVCPKSLIAVDKKLNKEGLKTVKFDQKEKCLGCCFCAVICPDCCIEVYK
jgi:2-oxoglutarate ferredoxin oxidoreductase subunit delta